jgi:hypothetical protein
MKEVFVMVKKTNRRHVRTSRPSALAERIAAGKADPISQREREIVAEIRASFIQKYGYDPGGDFREKTPSSKRK